MNPPISHISVILHHIKMTHGVIVIMAAEGANTLVIGEIQYNFKNWVILKWCSITTHKGH